MRRADHVAIFEHLAAHFPELFNFIKNRAIALESSGTSINSVINVPRLKAHVFKPKTKTVGRFTRRDVPKLPELKNELALWYIS